MGDNNYFEYRKRIVIIYKKRERKKYKRKRELGIGGVLPAGCWFAGEASGIGGAIKTKVFIKIYLMGWMKILLIMCSIFKK